MVLVHRKDTSQQLASTRWHQSNISPFHPIPKVILLIVPFVSMTFDDLEKLIADHKQRTPYGKVPVSWIKACFVKVCISFLLAFLSETFCFACVGY